MWVDGWVQAKSWNGAFHVHFLELGQAKGLKRASHRSGHTFGFKLENAGVRFQSRLLYLVWRRALSRAL
jgi:hypothetical protein